MERLIFLIFKIFFLLDKIIKIYFDFQWVLLANGIVSVRIKWKIINHIIIRLNNKFWRKKFQFIF